MREEAQTSRRSDMTVVRYDPCGKLEISGHAGMGRRGEDIVCAGISALCAGLVNFLAEDERFPSFSVEYGEGYLYCECSDPGSEDAFDLVLLGLRNIEAQYPEHLRIEEC